MRTTLIPLLLVSALLLTSAPVARAQDAPRPQATATISAVPVGEDLMVETGDGRTIKGDFRSINNSTLTLSRKNRATEVALTDVRRVYRLVGRSRKRAALVGAAAGGGAGLGLGLAVYIPGRDDIVGLIVPSFAVLGAGIGAAAGALTGRGRKRVLVYEAPQP